MKCTAFWLHFKPLTVTKCIYKMQTSAYFAIHTVKGQYLQVFNICDNHFYKNFWYKFSHLNLGKFGEIKNNLLKS